MDLTLRGAQARLKTQALVIVSIMALSTIIAVAGLLNYQSVSASPILFTDMSGRQVQMSGPADRIIVMESYWTEIACILGAQEKIVGIGAYAKDSAFIPASIKNLTVVGSMFSGVNLETIVALKPDVVVMDYGYGKSSSIIASLEGLGIPVVTLRGSCFEDITRATQMIARVVGAETQGRALSTYMSESHVGIISVSDSLPEQSKPSVLICNLDVWKDQLIYCYANSTWGRSVSDVGGINLALRDSPELASIKVGIEKVLAWNPDLLIIIGRESASLEAQIALMNNTVWNELDAVKEGRVYAVLSGAKDPEAFLDWTPRLVVGEMQLATIVQPSAFASLDWEEAADSLFERYYDSMLGR